ncbi:MAG: hypothetical protein GWP02_03390, partial [Desulfobulbaceae bacterium]|nr:hypothetical protein [Desulfobulbaceae bacterium]
STGAEVLRAELKELKTVVRPRIVAAIATAREHGDLKENAEPNIAQRLRCPRRAINVPEMPIAGDLSGSNASLNACAIQNLTGNFLDGKLRRVDMRNTVTLE